MAFVKGQSGNPSGRPGVPAEVRDLARKHTAEAIEKLVHWMRSDDARASVAAANALLDRGYGRPAQLLNLSVEDMSRRLSELSDAELLMLENRLMARNELSNGQAR